MTTLLRTPDGLVDLASSLKDKVVPIDRNVKVTGKTANDLAQDLEAVLDKYEGNVNQLETIGVLESLKFEILTTARSQQ